MKEKLVNNLSLKLFSAVMGFLIWLIVVNISNPEVTRTKTVPLEVINEQVLTGAGKTYQMVSGETVTVSYQCRTRDAYRIEADDFRAQIDLADMYAVTGSVPVTVDVVRHKDLITGTPTARPGVVRIMTEDIQNKSFPLTTRAEGEPAGGYAVGSMTLTPDSILVSGPVSEVGRISSVGVEVNVDGAASDLSGSSAVSFYDANGNKIDTVDERVTTSPESVYYDVHMLRGKSLILDFDVNGEAAPGFRFTGAECSVKSVAVVGEHEQLEGMTSITIPGTVLDVSGAKETKNVKIDINDYLPEGVRVDGESTVTVKLQVEALNTKVLALSLATGIEARGKREGYVYTLHPEIVSAELSGLPDDLNKILADDLKAKIDFSGLEPGTYEGKLQLTVPNGAELASITPFTVVVSSESEGPSGTMLPTEEENSGESEESGEMQEGIDAGTESEAGSAPEETAGESAVPAEETSAGM